MDVSSRRPGKELYSRIAVILALTRNGDQHKQSKND
jgi:hypothetical protein